MLTKLHIQNYAIIEQLEIEFDSSLNIITGETGAGKSILMGALSLILGDRADTAVLMNREQKSVVEGFFKVKDNQAIQTLLERFELDQLEELSIRREIAVTGKSRAFVNDTPVNLDQLRSISECLVDLHRQFDTLDLGVSDFQRDVLDALANQLELVQQYQQTFQQWQTALKAKQLLEQEKNNFLKEYDYNQFLFEELDKASFKVNELEDGELALKLMTSAEAIRNALTQVSEGLNEGESPISQQLRGMTQSLQGFASLHASLPSIVDRLQSAYIEIKDIGEEAAQVLEQVSFDPETMVTLQERLALGYTLQKKHAVHSTQELLALQETLSLKLQNMQHVDDAILEKEKEVAKWESAAVNLAQKIHEARAAVIAPLELQVNKLLAQVGMPNAQLKVQLTEGALNQVGMDTIEFLFDANKSNRFEPLRKVASGGELSRLMLCIKSLVAQSLNLPTLIFDEIDTGISGEAAKQVGFIMKALAEQRQVICITHQPQIAAKATAHFFVYKEAVADKITTHIRKLQTEEQVHAIAQMLSGAQPTAAAYEHAKELIESHA